MSGIIKTAVDWVTGHPYLTAFYTLSWLIILFGRKGGRDPRDGDLKRAKRNKARD